MSRIRMGLVGAVALGTAAFALPAGGAQAVSGGSPQSSTTAPARSADAQATCWSNVIRVDGGFMKYKECDKGSLRKVTGSVNDTKNNNKCVRGKIRFVPSGPTHIHKDCGGNVKKFNTRWQEARDAKVTLA
ncbi:hypothetical protein ACIRLA_37940 [Streptomyces sp. NPDC102364]|uniref:hypothetical protein n=1 Tax=unclassified Streptomyces TaxID=2593676 RepID=UPI003814C752